MQVPRTALYSEYYEVRCIIEGFYGFNNFEEISDWA